MPKPTETLGEEWEMTAKSSAKIHGKANCTLAKRAKQHAAMEETMNSLLDSKAYAGRKVWQTENVAKAQTLSNTAKAEAQA